MSINMYLPREFISILAIRDAIIPLVRSSGSPPRTMFIYLYNNHCDRQKLIKCLAV